MIFSLLVDFHHLLLLLHLVVGIALLQRGELRLHRFHLRHRGVGLVGEREEQQLHDHRHQQDGDAEIADQVIEEVQRQEHRLGDEVEPAPVDQQVEMVEPELLVVAAETADREIDADDAGFLGAGEQPRIGAAGAADRDGLRVLAGSRSDRSGSCRRDWTRSAPAAAPRCRATAPRPSICR